jgi:hypothetical protein
VACHYHFTVLLLLLLLWFIGGAGLAWKEAWSMHSASTQTCASADDRCFCVAAAAAAVAAASSHR